MFDDDKKKIEELINDWVFCMDDKKFFSSNKITSDFFLVDTEGEVKVVSQLLAPENNQRIKLKQMKARLDLINRIDFSPDGKFAFVAFSETAIFAEKDGIFPFKTTMFFLNTGYLKKIENEWKFAWVSASGKVVERQSTVMENNSVYDYFYDDVDISET